MPSSPVNAAASSQASFLVVCLCAEWCGTCRDYRPGFDELAAQFGGVEFRWVDIEDQADEIGDLDVENFPTLLIKRHGAIVFYGTMLPHLGHLRRTLETFAEQTAQQASAYALSDPLRRSWQENADLVALSQHG
jgi:thiol-disulfide isomerase/thioredoxin